MRPQEITIVKSGSLFFDCIILVYDFTGALEDARVVYRFNHDHDKIDELWNMESDVVSSFNQMSYNRCHHTNYFKEKFYML